MAKILLDHPEAQERAAAIEALAGARAGIRDGTDTPLLDAAEWAALKRICAAVPQQDQRGK
jgi:hypothetical protein